MGPEHHLEWVKGRREYREELDKARRDYLEGKIPYKDFEEIVYYGQRFEDVETLEARLREAEESLAQMGRNPELDAGGRTFLSEHSSIRNGGKRPLRLSFWRHLITKGSEAFCPLEKIPLIFSRYPQLKSRSSF